MAIYGVGNEVVWRMRPGQARALAELFRISPPHNGRWQSLVDALNAAADHCDMVDQPENRRL